MFKKTKASIKHQKKYPLKKEAILKAAIEKFSDKGYSDTSVEEIAKRVNLGKGTIYHYFTNKEEILETIIKNKTMEMLQVLESISKSNLSPLSKLEKIIQAIMSFLHNNLNYFIITLRHFTPIQSDTEELLTPPAATFQDFYEKQTKIIEDLLKEAQGLNYIPPMDIREITTLLIGMINYSILYWIKNRPSQDLIEWMRFGMQDDPENNFFPKRVQVLIKLFFHGIKGGEVVSNNLPPLG